MKIDLKRFKNYGLWVSIFAFIPILCQGLGMDIIPANWQIAVQSILGILVGLGLLNNPNTETKGFSDDI
jgi:uncharacterized membrane protein